MTILISITRSFASMYVYERSKGNNKLTKIPIDSKLVKQQPEVDDSI